MLTKHNLRSGKPLEESVGDHGRGAAPQLLGRLKDRHDGARPCVPPVGEHEQRANQASGVHVMPAGMRNGDSAAGRIDGYSGARVRQARSFSDRQRVHIGAQHDHRSIPVAQHRDYASASDASGDVETQGFERGHHGGGRVMFLHRQLGVAVQVAIQLRDLLGDPRCPGGENVAHRREFGIGVSHG